MRTDPRGFAPVSRLDGLPPEEALHGHGGCAYVRETKGPFGSTVDQYDPPLNRNDVFRNEEIAKLAAIRSSHPNGEHVRTLTSSKGFGGTTADNQTASLNAMGAWPTERKSEALQRLLETKPFDRTEIGLRGDEKLSKLEQRMLIKNAEHLSPTELAKIEKLPRGEQAQKLRELFSRSMQGKDLGLDFGDHPLPPPARQTTTLGAPKTTSETFKDEPMPRKAFSYPVEVGPSRKKVEIVIPAETKPPMSPVDRQALVDRTAKSLGTLPEKALDRLGKVQLSDKENTRGYASTNWSGHSKAEITVYLNKKSHDQQSMDDVLLHESGHCVSLGTGNWGLPMPDSPGNWGRWEKAMKADGIAVSAYARENMGDDFAETWRVFNTVPKGSPEYSRLKALMPNRFAMLEDPAVP